MTGHEIAQSIGAAIGAGLGTFIATFFQKRRARQLAEKDNAQQVQLDTLTERVANLERRAKWTRPA